MSEHHPILSGSEAIKDKQVLKGLSRWIRLPEKFIKEVVSIIESPSMIAPVTLSGVTQDREIHNGYYSFKILKSNGKDFRTISAPCDKLKLLQSCMKDSLGTLTNSIAISGGEPGTSPRKNVEIHRENANWYVIANDLKDAYPTITTDRIKGNLKGRLRDTMNISFPYYGYNERSRFIDLTSQLSSYKGRLPQGAPTSPRIFNMSLAKTDKKIISMIHEESNGLYNPLYSRYLDDTTNSFKFDLSQAIHSQISKSRTQVTRVFNELYKNTEEQSVRDKASTAITKNINPKLIELYGLTKNIDLGHTSEQKMLNKKLSLLRESLVALRKLYGESRNFAGVVDEHNVLYEAIGKIDLIKKSVNSAGSPEIDKVAMINDSIKTILHDEGWKISEKKNTIRTPNSSLNPEITGIIIGPDGRLGIARSKMKKYILFANICANYPSKLPKRFRLKSGEIDWLRVGYRLQGIHNFLKDVKGEHVPKQFQKYYDHVFKRYLKQHNALRNSGSYYSYTDVNGSELADINDIQL